MASHDHEPGRGGKGGKKESPRRNPAADGVAANGPPPTTTRPSYQPSLSGVVFVFCAGLGTILFILVYDDLKNNRLAQLIAACSMALCIAVILYSLVPSGPTVRSVAGLGGAALFYWKLLPLISASLFPPTELLRGTIGYVPSASRDHAGLRPVQGAIVAVPDTASQPTGDKGEFTIEGAPSGTKSLLVIYRNHTYSLDLDQYKNHSYPIVPSDVDQNPNEGVLRINAVVDHPLSWWVKDLERSFNVTISTVGCDAAALAAPVDSGLYQGRTAEEFLEAIKERIKAGVDTFRVHTLMEGMRYEIICK